MDYVAGFVQGSGYFDADRRVKGDAAQRNDHGTEQRVGNNKSNDDGIGVFGAQHMAHMGENIGRNDHLRRRFHNDADLVGNGVNPVYRLLSGSLKLLPSPVLVEAIVHDRMIFIVPIYPYTHVELLPSAFITNITDSLL